MRSTPTHSCFRCGFPPGCAKSHHVSIAFPAWWLAHRKQANVIAASHSAELAARRPYGLWLQANLRQLTSGLTPIKINAVAMRGVNDDADTLGELMRVLVENRIKPYYLHHPDLAPGTRHFRLNIEAGKRLHAELSRRLTGIGVPAYVLDIPGGFGKTPVAGMEADGSGGFRVTDPTGRVHFYRDDL